MSLDGKLAEAAADAAALSQGGDALANSQAVAVSGEQGKMKHLFGLVNNPRCATFCYTPKCV